MVEAACLNFEPKWQLLKKLLLYIIAFEIFETWKSGFIVSIKLQQPIRTRVQIWNVCRDPSLSQTNIFLLILDNDSSGKPTRCREKRHLNWMFFLSICRKPLRFYVEKELINLFSLLVWNFEPSKCKTAWNQQKEWTRLKHPKQRKRTKYQCKTWKVFIFSFFHVVTWFGIDLPGELLKILILCKSNDERISLIYVFEAFAVNRHPNWKWMSQIYCRSQK